MLAKVKDNLNVFMCGEDNPKCSNCGQPHMASSKDCQHFIREKEIQKIKSEKNSSYPEARRFVSAANDSPTQKSYASVAKRVFNLLKLKQCLLGLRTPKNQLDLLVNQKKKI